MTQLLWHFVSCHYNRYNTRTCPLDHMGPSTACQRPSSILTQPTYYRIILTLFRSCNQQLSGPVGFCSAHVGSHYPRSPYRKFPECPRLWFQVPSVYYVVVLSFLHERRASKGPPLCFEEQGPSLASPKVRGNFSLAWTWPLTMAPWATYPSHCPSFCYASAIALEPVLRKWWRSQLRLSPPSQGSFLHRGQGSLGSTEQVP